MSLGRAIAAIAGPTMLSRVLGFVRDIATAAILGAGPVADAFFIAFKLPNFFRRLFAEGAFSSAFVPLFAGELHAGGKEAGRDFAREAQAALLMVLLPFVAILLVAMPWVLEVLAPGLHDEPATFELAVQLGRITFPYLLFISLVSLYGGVLNGLGYFAQVAATPVLLNLALIAALFGLTPFMPNGGYAMAVGVFAAGVLQFIWLFVVCARLDMAPWLTRPRRGPRVTRLWRLILPAAIGSGATQVSSMLDVVWASLLPTGAISALYYADRLYQLPVGVIGAAIGTALLPMLTRAVRSGDVVAAGEHQNRAIELALLLALPAAGALAVLAEPIIVVLFQRGAFGASEAARTSSAVTAYALGLPAFILVKALIPGFYAREDTSTPLYVALVCIVAGVALNGIFLLTTNLQQAGIALATSISGVLNAALIAALLARRRQLAIDPRLRRALPRILAASALLMLVLWLVRHLPLAVSGTAARIAALLALCLVGMIVYGTAVWIAGVIRPADLRRSLQRGAATPVPGVEAE